MLSILIAVYNTEKFLPKCLDSLRYNDYKDLEIIAVDDCSTDSSLEILQRYAAEDSRFKVIHLEQNGGLAHARNIALNHATGEWVMMLDSDDWLGPIQAISEEDTDCWLLQCDYVYPDGRVERFPLAKKEWTPQQACADSLLWQGIHGLYIVRTEIHKKYPYDESSRVFSDENSSRQHFLHSNRIRVCDTVYYYRQHAESITHKVSKQHIERISAIASLQHTLEQEPLATEAMIQQLRNYRWRLLTDIWHFYLRNKKQLDITDEDMKPMRKHYDELISTKITDPVCHRFGYLKLRPYSLYLFQVKAYFWLRKLLRRKN